MRALLLVITICLAGLSSAQPQFGDPQTIARDLLVPASSRSTTDIAVAAFGDGYVVAWIDGGAVRLVQLNAAGELIDEVPRTISASQSAQNVMIATDGIDILVGWSLLGGFVGHNGFRLVVLEGGTRHTITQRGVTSLDALTYTGNRYIAVIGGADDRAEVVELDRRGFTVASESLGIHVTQADAATLRQRFFVDRGVAWLVTIDGRPMRLALTDADDKPQRGVIEPLPIALPAEHELFSAGHIAGRWYVVYREEGKHYVRFASGPAIAINGVSEIVHLATRVSGGELYLFGLAHGESGSVLRGVRVSPNRRVRRFDIASGTPAWAAGSVAIPRGVLLVAANTSSHSSPAARIIRTLADRTFVRPPVALHWTPATQLEITVAAHGAGFLAAWHQPGIDGNHVWICLLERDGTPVGEPREIGRGTGAKIASNGDVALMVWSDWALVQARRIDAGGVPIGDATALDRVSGAIVIGAGWDGAQFAVAWASNANFSATALSATGELLTAEPVRLGDLSVANQYSASFAVSPFGALLVYTPSDDHLRPDRTMGLRLTRELRPAGAPFEIANVATYARDVVWTGQHYVVTLMHFNSLRASRVSPSGEALDAPYGVWLGEGTWFHHRAAYANGKLLVIHGLGGLVTDTELRNPVAFTHVPLPTAFALAMREDGAALVAYASSTEGASLATVRPIDSTR